MCKDCPLHLKVISVHWRGEKEMFRLQRWPRQQPDGGGGLGKGDEWQDGVTLTAGPGYRRLRDTDGSE